MKVLTLTQPFATLVAIGAKKIETRSWSTSYRGELAIHAAKGLGPVGGRRGLQDLCGTEPFCSVLNAAMKVWDTPPKSMREMVERPFMPFGAIVAVCELVDCHPTCGDGYEVLVDDGVLAFTNWHRLSDQELAFGDYTPGRYAWILRDIRALPEPIPCKGALSLWEPDTLTQLAIKRQEIAQL